MKTTLDLEPELYIAAKQLARSQKKSLGQVVSELLRRALGLSAAAADVSVAELERRNGFDVFPERSGPRATIAAVQQLCREEGI
jgi:negative regulator of replication initiation